MLLIALIGIPVIAMGARHTPPGQWWHNPEVLKQINLTEQEVDKLDKAYLDNRRKLIDLKSQLEKERLELSSLLNNEETSEAEFMKQFGQMENSRTRLATERFRFAIEVMKIVGPERYRTLKTLYDRSHKARHHMHKRPKGSYGKGEPDKQGPRFDNFCNRGVQHRRFNDQMTQTA